MSANQSGNPAVGFTSLLLLLFIGLKLGNVIDWSWWWVLSPFWIPIALLALLLGAIVVSHGINKLRGKNG